MTRISDISLITQAVLLGSERAFAKLVEAHQAAVRRFLRSLCSGNETEADDLAQETFIRAWQGLQGFQGLSGFETWLLRIAYHVFLDSQRRHTPKYTLSLDDECPPAKLQEAVAVTSETSSTTIQLDLQTALLQLSPEQRTCIVLQLMEGQDIRHICHITGMTEGTVKSHLSRGKKSLANYLRHNGYNG